MNILKDIIKPIFAQMKNFLSKEMGVQLESKNIKLLKLQKPILKDISAFVTIKELKITLLISYDLNLIEYLTNRFSMEDLSELSAEEKEEYMESVACEIVNIVMGNAINLFPKELQNVTITPPYFTKEVECKYKFKYSLSSLIKTNHNEFSINYLKG